MIETSSRLLALLGLLQARQDWSGADLAATLQVSERTIRNDVARLRAMDYPVESVRGPGGRYRLGTSGRLPSPSTRSPPTRQRVGPLMLAGEPRPLPVPHPQRARQAAGCSTSPPPRQPRPPDDLLLVRWIRPRLRRSDVRTWTRAMRARGPVLPAYSSLLCRACLEQG